MDTPQKTKDSVRKILERKKSVKQSIETTINEEGVIDVIALRELNQPLADVFDIITLSKTWRDEPWAFSRDVARLLAARDPSNELSEALDALEQKLKESK